MYITFPTQTKQLPRVGQQSTLLKKYVNLEKPLLLPEKQAKMCIPHLLLVKQQLHLRIA